MIILAGNDPEQATMVHASLCDASIVPAVLKLPDLPEKGDVSDWLDADGTSERLLKLAAEAFDKGPETPPGATRHEAHLRVGDAQLVRDRNDRLVWNTANAVAILESDPAWQGVLAYDELAARHMVMRPLPCGPSVGPVPRILTDADVTRIVAWFNRNGFPRAGRNIAFDVVATVAERNRFNECTSYLEGLEWDGVEPSALG